MKKRELKLLLSLALESVEADRALADANHDRGVSLTEELEKAREALTALGNNCRGYEMKYLAASEKLNALGCTCDADGLRWLDPVPKPESFTREAVVVKQPTMPPGCGWNDGQANAPVPSDSTLLEWVDYAGLHHTDHASEIISWNGVAWWRFATIMPTEGAAPNSPTAVVPERSSYLGIARPRGNGWGRGDSAASPRSDVKVEVILQNGFRGHKLAKDVTWSVCAWWRLAE